ncbi:MAG: inositol monophosphatase family protein [Pseudomonadota bacterium]
MATRSATLNVMIQAANKAARTLKRDFGEVENLQVSRKGPADFVSAADLKAEKTLRQELAKARPGYGFLLEESGPVAGAPGESRRWIVDPLDGTTNFLHGLPHFAISIALEDAGELVAAVVLDPIKDDLFYAEKGKGAYLHDRRIRTSGRQHLSNALIATGVPFKGREIDPALSGELAAIMTETAGLRRWGTASLDLAYVAAGRYEGFWERGLEPWDIAAGILLVREAGGYVTGLDGRPVNLEDGSVLAANDSLHGPLSRLLKRATAPAG